MRTFQTIDVINTVGEWVDAFNNNALAASDHTWYLGEMLYNGVLYTGLETIGGVQVKSLTNLNIAPASPQNLELDNFYIYFRTLNKILLVDQVTFDLRQYNTGHPLFFYLNSELGYRVSATMDQHDDEIMLFRFILDTNGVFSQCYVTAQRFGSNVYDTADEFYIVKGCQPLPVTGLQLKLGDGAIKRSGIKLDYHQVPDVLPIKDNNIPFNLRYVTKENQVNYKANVETVVNPNRMLNYTTKTFSNVPNNKFTIQRILYDVYCNCLIMQYGDVAYDSLQDAMSAIHNVTYPFPYDALMYIPLGLMFIKKGCTNLANAEECILVQNTNTTITQTDSAFFAEDAYARGRIQVLINEASSFDGRITALESTLSSHVGNHSNPHQVTKAQVGLGNVDNMSYTQIQSTAQNAFDDRYVKKSGGDTMANGTYQVNGTSTTPAKFTTNAYTDVEIGKNFIKINGIKLYLGAKPADAEVGSYAIE